MFSKMDKFTRSQKNITDLSRIKRKSKNRGLFASQITDERPRSGSQNDMFVTPDVPDPKTAGGADTVSAIMEQELR